MLSLAITSHLFPRLEAERFGAGELTKIRAQTVSGRSCRAVAERLGVPERLAAAAPAAAAATVPNLVSTERVLASIREAVIGACYLTFGYEPVAEAVVQAFQSELTEALEHPVDFKSALQERLARRGALVSYAVITRPGRRTTARLRSLRGSARTRSAAGSVAARRTRSRPPHRRRSSMSALRQSQRAIRSSTACI